MPDAAPSPSDELTVGQLAARSGVAVSALHFYEREGLITSRRTPGNQRRFTRETLRRVAFVRASQRVGIPLARLRAALATLPGDRTPTAKDWHRLSAGWHADLAARIAQLTRLRDHLTDCIGCGCLSLRRCVLVKPHDARAVEGPGPRTLLVEGIVDGATRRRASGPLPGRAAGPLGRARCRGRQSGARSDPNVGRWRRANPSRS